MDVALASLGVTEVPGPDSNPVIDGWVDGLGLKLDGDNDPWCAVAMGYWLETAGIKSTRSAAARSYETYGVPLGWPAYGAIVTLWRGSPESWQGHAGLLVGRDERGRPMLLSANVKDRVGIDPFDPDRVTAIRWPTIKPFPERYRLPLLSSDGLALSENEA